MLGLGRSDWRRSEGGRFWWSLTALLLPRNSSFFPSYVSVTVPLEIIILLLHSVPPLSLCHLVLLGGCLSYSRTHNVRRHEETCRCCLLQRNGDNALGGGTPPASALTITPSSLLITRLTELWTGRDLYLLEDARPSSPECCFDLFTPHLVPSSNASGVCDGRGPHTRLTLSGHPHPANPSAEWGSVAWRQAVGQCS